MKLKKPVALIFLFLVMAVFVQAADTSYLHLYKWELSYNCYENGFNSIWRFCQEICINNDGYIYNRHDTARIGEWTPGPGIGFEILLYSDCGDLYGAIFFLPSPSIAMEGQGWSNYLGPWKFAKLLMVRGDRR